MLSKVYLVEYESETPGGKGSGTGALLAAQCLGVCLPMQETRVLSLVREDPTRPGVTKPVCHSY